MQNVYVSLLALIKLKLRATKKAEKLTKQLLKQESDGEALNKYQDEKLAAAIINAQRTPFYQNRVEACDKLASFPYINKQDVLQQPLQFFNSQDEGKRFSGATSGTTGSPLTIYQNLDSIESERAFADRQRAWAGFKLGDKRAWIRGDLIVPLAQKIAPFWRFSSFENMILLSSFHMTTSALPLYIQAMVDYGVDVIQAYPSSIITLAKYLKHTDQFYPAKLKSILTSSESLSKEDKLLIEERFKCPVFDWYGLFERVAAIASCEQGKYHILTDYSHVELLPAGEVNGKKRTEIVGTNFNNTLYPLIRYKTGDHVILSDEKHCLCGRAYPIIESIEGRVGDYLMGEDGQEIYILNHIPKGVSGLIATQFVQKDFSEVTVLVVVDKQLFTSLESNKLIDNTKERLGQSIKVMIIEVDAIPRTKNGKVRQAICEVSDHV